jgi:hypothetical protein
LFASWHRNGRDAAKPKPQLLGQLPVEHIILGPVFDKIGVNYAGLVLVKYGYVRKPVIVKAYICVFVSLTVKAVHLEAVSDLTTDAFVAHFIAHRGRPVLLWSDHGSNFVGADREIQDMIKFLKQQLWCQSSVPCRTSPGSLSQSVHFILVDYGRLQ